MILLAKNFDSKKDYSGWFISEKLDGYRAVWNGTEMISRHGNKFNIPKEIINTLPKNIILDGELFISRGNFEKCSILKKKNITINEFLKIKIKYNVFDIISSKKKYKDKIEDIKKICNTNHFLIFIKQKIVKNNVEIKNIFNKLIQKGAEGIMLRDPNSVYEKKRSNTLVKLKAKNDDEAIIIGYSISTSKKYEGLLKSFHCKLKKNLNITFYVSGVNDNIRTNFRKTHPINTVITFTHNGFTSYGIPRHPFYKQIYCNL